MANSTKIFTIFVLFMVAFNPSHAEVEKKFYKSLESFGQKLFGEIIKSNEGKNIIYSPLSVQTSLAMVRMGADGETAIEMDKGLSFNDQSVESVAENYHTIISDFKSSDLVALANKLYITEDAELLESYKNIIEKKFLSSVETIDFSHSKKAAETINEWVEENTNNIIKDLLSPEDLDDLTKFVLLNAIHFKGDWLKPFNEDDTEVKDFYLNDQKSVKIPIMSLSEHFFYKELPELDASMVRLPYNNSDLSMLIILPNERNGLADMQQKLLEIGNWETLLQDMEKGIVDVELPKFKVEFEIELNEALKNLGMSNLFNNPNFGKMLKSPNGISISKAIHKASIEVTEKGTEAVAATNSIAFLRTGHFLFNAHHPFFYAIINTDNVVLFQGNVVTFDN